VLTRKGSRLAALAAALGSMGLATAALANDQVSGVSSDDPWESMNRKTFAFNEKLDLWILRPVAVGWDKVVPESVQRALGRAFSNARFPVVFVNELLQAKPLDATRSLGRFLMNTTIGWGGLFDPAAEVGLEASNEDFGQTLGYWGVPPGPYLVLPALGPSSPRDTAGYAVDSMMLVQSYFIPWYIWGSVSVTNIVNTRARYIEEIDENRRTALDFYAFQRNAYLSYRENLVNDREETDDSTVEGEGLYFFDDEEEDSDAGSSDGDT